MGRLKSILIFIFLLTENLVHSQNLYGRIPDEIKQYGDSIILTHLGSDVFKRTNFLCERSMIALDLALSFNNNCSSNSRKTKSKNNKNSIDPKYYVLKYNLNIVDTSNYEFEVRISKDFELLNKVKLRKCVNSNVCTIEISRTEAVDLAIESGLEEGFEIYNEGLVLDEETETFQWIIKNHLKKGPDRGETIYIDALSGKRIVKKDSKWLRHIIH